MSGAGMRGTSRPAAQGSEGAGWPWLGKIVAEWTQVQDGWAWALGSGGISTSSLFPHSWPFSGHLEVKKILRFDNRSASISFMCHLLPAQSLHPDYLSASPPPLSQWHNTCTFSSPRGKFSKNPQRLTNSGSPSLCSPSPHSPLPLDFPLQDPGSWIQPILTQFRDRGLSPVQDSTHFTTYNKALFMENQYSARSLG